MPGDDISGKEEAGLAGPQGPALPQGEQCSQGDAGPKGQQGSQGAADEQSGKQMKNFLKMVQIGWKMIWTRGTRRLSMVEIQQIKMVMRPIIQLKRLIDRVSAQADNALPLYGTKPMTGNLDVNNKIANLFTDWGRPLCRKCSIG